MASILQVEQIQGPTSGANANTITIPSGQTLSVADGLPVDAMPAGSVVQVVSQNFPTADFQSSMTTGSKISGDLTITPKFNNSRILVQASQTNEIGQDGGTISSSVYIYARLYRGGFTPTGVQGTELDNASGHQFPRQARQHFTATWYDDPLTTNPITYAIHCSGGSNISDVRWLFYNITITAWEIKQ